MKIYSFQPLFIWEQIKKDGFYHPFDLFEKNEFLKEDLERAWGFPQSYIWLKEKMLEKGITYQQHNDHLIWGWCRWMGNKAKPDKRYASVFGFYDKPFVMLELELDDNRVCLHDYDAWHFVLNYWHLSTEKHSDDFCEKFDYFKEKPLSNSKGDKQVRQTWDIIFDLEKSRTLLEYDENRQCIQATFFEIFLSDVTKVHYFENNRCSKVEKIK